ncbi:MBL fold metallo-hydrolase RNA specificity domain-containing protein [Pseudomonas sp.]|uniref:MBL fold metallo-hydrolase RNA specificity domain-containing protein n=1 Tax=Pseudomonas sp. TaxID=306 RepID=UPI003525918C
MDEKCYAIRAQVHTIGGYSVHADQKGFLGFVTSMRPMAVTSADCVCGALGKGAAERRTHAAIS